MTPLAIEMLLWIESGRRMAEFPVGHYREIDIEAVSFTLLKEGLIGADFVDGTIEARGKAYLAILLATPLPVQRWIDPRDGRPSDFNSLISVRDDPRDFIKPDDPAPVAALNPSPEQKAAAYAATVPKPPEGFTHHLGLSSKMPDGLKPGDDIEVWYRDGKSGKQAKIGKRADVLAAASVNWQHRGGDDDVIGYRPMDMPAVVKMVMPKR